MRLAVWSKKYFCKDMWLDSKESVLQENVKEDKRMHKSLYYFPC